MSAEDFSCMQSAKTPCMLRQAIQWLVHLPSACSIVRVPLCVCCGCRLAKERSAEDHLFGDKEKFVTSAYKKKLEEDKKWLAEEKVREAQEQRNDVVKKGHMGDFYRFFSLHLLCIAFACKQSACGGVLCCVLCFW